MIDAAAIHHYAGVLRVFRARHPDVDLHLAVAASNELLDQLTRGALDVVVCVAPTEIAAGLDVEPMLTEPLALYAPKGAAAGPPEQWGPWVAFPASSNSRAIITAALRAAGAKIDVVAESHQPEVLKEMVRLGLGWTVLPVVQAESRPGALRRARPEPVAERTLVLARRAAGAPNPAADALIAALRQR
jgi:DNA-binding transcriptional LysR family regulator